jgi:rhodanese-related sulfurtransferase
MGLTPVAHIEGGYGAWLEAGGPTEITDVGMVKGGSE